MGGDLKYLGFEKGRVEHFFYSDKNSVYCLTKNLKEGRGDFYFFDFNEINRIAEQLSKKEIQSLFHPEDVVNNLNGFHGMQRLKKKGEGKESNYIQTRLTKICYYLVHENYLKIEKDGHKILFRKTDKMNSWKPLRNK